MSTEIQNFFGGNAPAMTDVASALAQSAKTAGEGIQDGGKPILKLNKGDWCYGASNTDVEEDSEWAVNPMSVKTGYVAWKDRSPFKSVMAALGETPVNKASLDSDLGEHTKGKQKGEPVTWDECISIELICASGEDTGTMVRYETTTYGGRQALTALIQEMSRAAALDPNKIIPVVVLRKDSYDHKEWGRVFTPVFDIQEFVTADDLAGIEPVGAVGESEPEPEPEPQPKRRAAKRAKAEPEQVEGEVIMDAEMEDEPATVPPGRRRRRRG